MSNGSLDVLNVGHGHLTFRFEKNDADETAKAKAVITDMLRRGYMLFVKDAGEQKRVRAFDPNSDEYILEEPDSIVVPEPTGPVELAEPKRKRGRPAAGKRLAMKATMATGIGPTAGG